MSAVTTTTEAESRQGLRRAASAGLVGTTLEFYDHFVFGSAAALVFPKLFFPQDDRSLATLLSMVIYAVAFIARPIGGAAFGHFGDKLGRKAVLLSTLVMMGTATVLIGLLPTYATLGLWAPILLVLLRSIQGFALGGEWGGAALLVAEFDPAGRRRGFFGSLVQVASPIGVLLANAVFAIVTWSVSEQAFFSWGWRIPFLISTVLIVYGIYVRSQIGESPIFEDMARQEAAARSPIVETLRDHWGRLLLAIGSRAGEGVIFYVFSLFLLIYGPQHLGITRSTGLVAVIMGAGVGVVAIPFFGWLSDRVGRVPVVIGGAVGAAIWSVLYFLLLHTRNPTIIVIAGMIGMFFQAALWAPAAAFVPEMFPAQVRCTAASIAFQTALVFGGAFSPVAAVWLVSKFDTWIPVAAYSIISLIVVIICAASVGETLGVDLTAKPQRDQPLDGRATRHGRAVKALRTS
ncbi:MAG TPA: MFS transporter [Nitrobacter sp.]|jgi:MFS family permease|nr:MFS transporter [Nitrobacter sp.]